MMRFMLLGLSIVLCLLFQVCNTLPVVTDNSVIRISRQDVIDDCGCGLENAPARKQSRILGGSAVDPAHRFPWTVALVDESNKLIGGGTIITSRHILTAAHCCVESPSSTIRIVLGAHNITGGSIPIDILECRIHPNYQDKSYLHDIAILVLKEPIYYHDLVSPMCVVSSSILKGDEPMVVAGWGRTKEVSATSDTLLSATVRAVDRETCKKALGSDVLDTNICAGGNNQDTCQGDSGGPLMVQASWGDRLRWVQVGLVSWGVGCGRPGLPGIYTRIEKYKDFIVNNTGVKFCEPELSDLRVHKPEEVQPPSKPNYPNCGIANQYLKRSSRIVGGAPTFPRKYPWLAAITYRNNLSGSGVYIGNGFVLSAASNFGDNAITHPDLVKVFLNVHSRSESYESFDVESVIVHRAFKFPYNDVVLVKLKQNADDNKDIRPVCLVQKSDAVGPNEQLLVTGWGRVHNHGPFSDVPVEIHLNPVSKLTCDITYDGAIDDHLQLCAMGRNRDICDGDGGSPMMRYSKGRYYLVAIASSGSDKGCAAENTPSVFTRLTSILDWIFNTAGIAIA